MRAATHARLLHKTNSLSTRVPGQGAQAPRAGIFTHSGKIPDSRAIGGRVPAPALAQGAASGNAGGEGIRLKDRRCCGCARGEAPGKARSPRVILGRGRSPSCPGPIVRQLPNLEPRSSTLSAGTEACGARRRLDPGHKARDDNVMGGEAMSAATHAHVLHKSAASPTRVPGQAEPSGLSRGEARAGIFTRTGKIPDSRAIDSHVPAFSVAQGAASGNAGEEGSELAAARNRKAGGFAKTCENTP
jgi:hypothetical protein